MTHPWKPRFARGVCEDEVTGAAWSFYFGLNMGVLDPEVRPEIVIYGMFLRHGVYSERSFG